MNKERIGLPNIWIIMQFTWGLTWDELCMSCGVGLKIYTSPGQTNFPLEKDFLWIVHVTGVTMGWCFECCVPCAVCITNCSVTIWQFISSWYCMLVLPVSVFSCGFYVGACGMQISTQQLFCQKYIWKERGNQLIQNVDNRFTPGFSWNKFLVVSWLAIYPRPGQFVTYSMLMSDMFHPFWHPCNSPLEKDFLPISHVTGVMMCRCYVCCMLCACLHY